MASEYQPGAGTLKHRICAVTCRTPLPATCSLTQQEGPSTMAKKKAVHEPASPMTKSEIGSGIADEV